MLKYTFIFFGLLSVFGACTSQKIVQPLEDGENQLSGNIGGPLIGFAGTTIPIPLTSINYARGITDSLTFHTGIQTTSLIYKTLQLDAGVTYGFFIPNGWIPGLSASGSLNYLNDFRAPNFKIYPQIDLNAYWEYGELHFMYFGVTNWIELSNIRAHDEDQTKRILTGIQFGNTFSTPQNWNFTIESKWLAPTRNSKNLTIDYKTYSINNQPKGAVGIYLGIAKRF
ncbi:MAG: hypothetical protein KJP21_01165 [Bacteroidia bacterium]|nr:hypothetical protein [Bacteroidia bacterium]NNJ55846.1 hypothetical protein [Bacteroidia bacterium]